MKTHLKLHLGQRMLHGMTDIEAVGQQAHLAACSGVRRTASRKRHSSCASSQNVSKRSPESAHAGCELSAGMLTSCCSAESFACSSVSSFHACKDIAIARTPAGNCPPVCSPSAALRSPSTAAGMHRFKQAPRAADWRC